MQKDTLVVVGGEGRGPTLSAAMEERIGRLARLRSFDTGWSLRHVVSKHFFLGVSALQFVPFLAAFWPHLDALAYLPRLLVLLLLSLVNTLLAVPDAVYLFGLRVVAWRWSRVVVVGGNETHVYSSLPLAPKPLFVLGHPRTGTTLLHYALARDPQFVTCTTFQGAFPLAFLTLSWLLKPLLVRMLDPVRPMDRMALSPDTPMEDEVPLCPLTGGLSPYMPLVLPRSSMRFFRYFTFEHATRAEREHYQSWFLYLWRKITYAAGYPPKRMLVKSPCHTARIKMFLEMFPDAQFIYIHRHPYEVFQSACHLADSYYKYTYLQHPSNEDLMRFIIYQFDLLHEEYIAARDVVPPGNLIELSYHDVERDIVGELKRVYETLNLGDFEKVRPLFETYTRSRGVSDYQKNSFNELSQEVKDLVYQCWKPHFDEFGYSH